MTDAALAGLRLVVPSSAREAILQALTIRAADLARLPFPELALEPSVAVGLRGPS